MNPVYILRYLAAAMHQKCSPDRDRMQMTNLLCYDHNAT